MRSLELSHAQEPRPALLLVRLATGAVFLSEGLQKFLYPLELGYGRFGKIGIPHPAFMATFVGNAEVVCGLFLLVGLWTRFAALVLWIDISVAIATTKLPMLAKSGFWKTAHEARTDWAMWCCLLFLLISGAGPLSLDSRRR